MSPHSQRAGTVHSPVSIATRSINKKGRLIHSAEGDRPRRFVLSLCDAIALSATTVALARDFGGAARVHWRCFQFCRGAIPDRDRVFAFLKDNRNVISAACDAGIAPYLPTVPAAAKQEHAQGKTPATGRARLLRMRWRIALTIRQTSSNSCRTILPHRGSSFLLPCHFSEECAQRNTREIKQR